jgi:hypothetical protein
MYPTPFSGAIWTRAKLTQEALHLFIAAANDPINPKVQGTGFIHLEQPRHQVHEVSERVVNLCRRDPARGLVVHAIAYVL